MKKDIIELTEEEQMTINGGFGLITGFIVGVGLGAAGACGGYYIAKLFF